MAQSIVNETEATGTKKEILTGGGYLRIIRTNRNYRLLWLAQVISLLGDWFDLVAVMALVLHYGGSAQALSGLLILRLAPMFLLGPVAGVLADRFNRRNLLLLADMGRAVMVLGFLLVGSADNLWLVYVLTLAQFSLAAVFEPARTSLVPALTRPEERVAANALASLTWSMLLAIGAALGGLTAGLVGIQAAFIIDSLSFVGSALLVLGIPAALGYTHETQSGKINLAADLKAGLAYLKVRPAIFSYTLIKPIAALTAGGIYLTIIGLQARNVYPLGNDGSLSLGLLYLAIGLGSGLGPLLSSKLLRRMGENRANLQKLIGLSFALIGTGYALFAGTNNLLLAIVFIILAELGGGSQWVFSSTLLQLSVDEEFRGRVASVEISFLTICQVISLFVGGLLLDQLKLPVATIGVGLLVLTVTLGLVWMLMASRLAAKKLEKTQEAELRAA